LKAEDKNLGQFQRIIELCTQKIVTKLSKIWVWDPESGKNLSQIPDPGVKMAPDPGYRIGIWDTLISVQHSELGLEMHDQPDNQSLLILGLDKNGPYSLDYYISGTDSCKGDSGGGLYTWRDGAPTLMGVVSRYKGDPR
jgi:hypothetical protein